MIRKYKKTANKMKILIVFGYGNLFLPRAGNESRLNHITRGLAIQNDVITLERMEFQKNIEDTNIVQKRYFFNDLNFKHTHFGVFFSDFNPFYFLKIHEIIKNESPDIIQISYPRGVLAAKLCKLLNRSKNIEVIYESHDVQIEVSKVNSNDLSVSYIKRKVIYFYDKIIERIAVSVADHITTVSDLDKAKFIDLYSIDPLKITVIPSPIEIPKLDGIGSKIKCRDNLGIESDKIVVIFHGVYNYLPNREAVNWIENYIAPEINKIYDNVTFVIAGKGLIKGHKNNIIYLGFVDNLHEFLKTADIAIVPVLKGGGTRIKILDYLCMGLPIVTTKKGIEGIEAENGKSAIIVDDLNDEFLTSLINLIEHEQYRKNIGANARRLADEKYEYNKVGEKLSNLYHNLAKNKKSTDEFV